MINDGFRLLPEQASSHAWDVDLLYYFLLLMSTLFTIGIASSIIYFAIKYRQRQYSRGSHDSPQGFLLA